MKKVVSLFLALMLLLAVASGCSKADRDSNNGTSVKTSSTGEKVEETKDVMEERKNITLRFLTPYNLNVEKFAQGEDVNKNIIIDYIREKTGYNIIWEMLPKENPDQRLSIVLASGDVPDCIKHNAKEIFFKLAGQGALAEVDELLTTYGKNLVKVLDMNLLENMKVNGKLYGIGYPQTTLNYFGLMARTDILKAKGYSIPKTLDEYYEVMKGVSDSKKGIYGLSTFTVNNSVSNGFSGAFGIGTNWKDKDGKLVYSFIQPEAKEYLTYMKKLYDEKILDPEFVLKKVEKVNESLIAGKAAIGLASWPAAKVIVSTLKEKEPNAAVEFIAPPQGKDGQMGYAKNSPYFMFNLIPKNAKNPVDAMILLDLLATDDLLDAVSYGFENKHYKYENDKIQVLPEADNIQWRIVYQFVDTLKHTDNRMEMKGYLEYYKPLLQWTTLDDWSLHAPPLPTFDKNATLLNDMVEENYVKFILGERDLGKFDSFVKEVLDAGAKASEEEINQWYPTLKK